MQITFSPRESWPYDRASILVEADADGQCFVTAKVSGSRVRQNTGFPAQTPLPERPRSPPPTRQRTLPASDNEMDINQPPLGHPL
jgi:hypothetical protein